MTYVRTASQRPSQAPNVYTIELPSYGNRDTAAWRRWHRVILQRIRPHIGNGEALYVDEPDESNVQDELDNAGHDIPAIGFAGDAKAADSAGEDANSSRNTDSSDDEGEDGDGSSNNHSSDDEGEDGDRSSNTDSSVASDNDGEDGDGSTDAETENDPAQPEQCWRHLYICPSQGRYFGDRGSFVDFFDPLTGCEAYCAVRSIAPFGPMIVWRVLSTFNCEEGCDIYDDVLEEGVSSVPVIFRKDPYGELRNLIPEHLIG